MIKVYLIYDLMSDYDGDPAAALVTATLTESDAREEVLSYLKNDAGLKEQDWENIVERTGCRDMAELEFEIRHDSRHDKDLNIKVEEIYIAEK